MVHGHRESYHIFLFVDHVKKKDLLFLSLYTSFPHLLFIKIVFDRCKIKQGIKDEYFYFYFYLNKEKRIFIMANKDSNKLLYAEVFSSVDRQLTKNHQHKIKHRI